MCSTIQNLNSFFYLGPKSFLILVFASSLPCNKMSLDLLYINNIGSCLNEVFFKKQ